MRRGLLGRDSSTSFLEQVNGVDVDLLNSRGQSVTTLKGIIEFSAP